MSDPFVQSMCRASVETLSTNRSIAIISITDPHLRPATIPKLPGLRAVLRLTFWDVADPNQADVFTHEMADQILDFVNAHRDEVDAFVVHCEAGISRSAGVAEALSEALGFLVTHENGSEVSPNGLVFQTLTTAAGRRRER